MGSPFSYTRYLEAKRTVDDRALNRQVWDSLRAALGRRGMGEPLQVLEIGGGVGTMLTRLLAAGMWQRAIYRLVDIDPENIRRAPEYLADWAAGADWEFAARSTTEWRLARGDFETLVVLETADLYSLPSGANVDLLVANAVLDLLDLHRAVPVIDALTRPGGLLYFTINYDGLTLFEPEVRPELDNTIRRLYNQTMDERLTGGLPSGDSRTGRRLFMALQSAGIFTLAAGSSDWVVFAGPEGYPADEKYFVQCILQTVHQALQGHPELDAEQFAEWVASRATQIEAGELVYIAHQLDLLGLKPMA